MTTLRLRDDLGRTYRYSTTDIQDRFFRAVVDKQLYSLRPAGMLHALKKIGLRTRLGYQIIPLMSTLEGFQDMNARQVLLALRKQAKTLVGSEDTHIRRRIEYFFQVQMLPAVARRLMGNYNILTYLPTGRIAFPTGTTLWDLDKLEVLSLSLRKDRPVVLPDGKAFTVDHTDARLLALELDRATGVLHLGGSGLRQDGTPFSRCLLNRVLTFEPGTNPLALPGDNPMLEDQTLALHAAMELNLATGDFLAQFAPRLPQLWLGFRDVSWLQRELTPALKMRGLLAAIAWLRLGQPLSPVNPEFAWANLDSGLVDGLLGYDPGALSGWCDVEQVLGEQRANELLTDVWLHHRRHHEGLICVPADLFAQGSPQKPFERADQVFADMEPLLGRRIPVLDTDRDTDDKTLAKVQVLELQEAERQPYGWIGKTAKYDLSSVAIGTESDFA